MQNDTNANTCFSFQSLPNQTAAVAHWQCTSALNWSIFLSFFTCTHSGHHFCPWRGCLSVIVWNWPFGGKGTFQGKGVHCCFLGPSSKFPQRPTTHWVLSRWQLTPVWLNYKQHIHFKAPRECFDSFDTPDWQNWSVEIWKGNLGWNDFSAGLFYWLWVAVGKNLTESWAGHFQKEWPMGMPSHQDCSNQWCVIPWYGKLEHSSF